MPYSGSTRDNFFDCDEWWPSDDKDSDGLDTAWSHFSDDSNSKDGDIRTTQSENPWSRLLSDAENERLNGKIDLLVAALESGRQVNFDPNPVTGEIEVTAEFSEPSSDVRLNDSEAEITGFPRNFGHIISSRRQMNRSISSVLPARSDIVHMYQDRHDSSEKTTSTAAKPSNNGRGSSFESWENQIITGYEQPAEAQKTRKQQAMNIHKVLRRMEEWSSDPRGSRLARLSSGQVAIHRISPVPFDLSRNQQLRAPAVRSEGSGLDRSSPLFMKSYQRMDETAGSWTTESSHTGSQMRLQAFHRVCTWLDQIQTPPQLNMQEQQGTKAGAFNVWRDTEVESRNPKPATLTSQVLKDVSNLRQPAYLQYNSFAMDKLRSADAKPDRSPAPSSQGFGAVDELSRRAFISTRWMDSHRVEASKAVRDATRRALLEPSPQRQRSNPEKDVAPKGFLEEDEERKAHFELALARLEGRAPPRPGFPILRYVNTRGLYGSDVEVDLRQVRYGQPRAVRCETDSPNLAEQLEQMTLETREERRST